MRRLHAILTLAVGAFAPSCSCTKTVYVEVCDACCTDATDAPPDSVADARPDGPPDAMPDAPTCRTAGDTANHLEHLGGGGVWATMAVDGFGAVASLPDTAGGRLVRLGMDGTPRAAALTLPGDPAAVAFDGVGYWISERSGTTVQIRSVSATGTVGTPVAIGTGTPVYGALAVHPSGDVAVLWVAADASLRATVVPATGSAVETVLDTRTSIISVDVIGDVVAVSGTGARFVAVFEDENTGVVNRVVARPLAPAGTEQVISVGGATNPQRANLAPSATADTAVATWREDNDVHAVVIDTTGTPVLTDRVVITHPGLTRIGGSSGPSGGFEVLVDKYVSASTDRFLELYTFDSTGTQVGSARRIATICSLSYSEQLLAFVRNASVRYVTWFDMSLNTNVTAAF